MIRRHSLAIHADANLNDAITTTTYIDTALDNLDTAKAGHPTSTPGADPKGGGTPPLDNGERDNSNLTERAALTPDKAIADHKALTKAIRNANTNLRIAATIAQRWGSPEDNLSAIAERLTTADGNLWCDNHMKHYMRQVRRPGHTDCDFCTQFRAQYKRAAPIEILDHRARYGRLTETQTKRLITKADERIRAERKARKKENSVA